jgi:hypothetical protein
LIDVLLWILPAKGAMTVNTTSGRKSPLLPVSPLKFLLSDAG